MGEHGRVRVARLNADTFDWTQSRWVPVESCVRLERHDLLQCRSDTWDTLGERAIRNGSVCNYLGRDNAGAVMLKADGATLGIYKKDLDAFTLM